MFLRNCHPDLRPCRDDERRDAKLRPASHSFLPQGEPLVVTTILSLCVLLIYVGVWLYRLLGGIPLAY